MLHRIGLMKSAIQVSSLDPSYVDDNDVYDIVHDGNFRSNLFQLVQFLMPLLRFIRLADSEGEVACLVYSRYLAIKSHFEGNPEKISTMPSVAGEILALFNQESKTWISDMHIPLHVLNPETSNDFRKAEVNLAVRNFFNKIFADDAAKCVQALVQLSSFVDRLGEFATLTVQTAMKNTTVSIFWRLYGSSTPIIQEVAIGYAPQKNSSSSAERNWKKFKDIRTKKRNKMLTTSVEKVVIVQSSLILEEKRLVDDNISKIIAWNDVDLIVAPDVNLMQSAESTAVVFINFIEHWENAAICEETYGNEKKLLRKCKCVCIYDEEKNFTGRIINVEWVKKARICSKPYCSR